VYKCNWLYTGDCTFESGACGWANSRRDDDDWVLLRGNYTGTRMHPTGDHTFGTGQGGTNGCLVDLPACFFYSLILCFTNWLLLS